MKRVVFALIGMLACLNGLDLSGIYKTSSFERYKDSFVRFFERDGKWYAYAIANVDGSPPGKDPHNHDPKLRNRSDKGVVFLYDLEKTGPNVYEHGRVYNFYDGRTYYVKITQKPDGDLNFFTSIDSTGFIGKSFLWKRVSAKDFQKLGIKEPDKKEVLKTLSELKP